MTEVKGKDLENIKGGGISSWIAIGVGAAVVFLIGLYDGFTRPLKCHE